MFDNSTCLKDVLKRVRIIALFVFLCIISFSAKSARQFIIDQSAPYYIPASYWDAVPGGGDTVFISSERTEALKFLDLVGDESNPIVFINKGGQVKINDDKWGAITFQDCKHIQISGAGHPEFKYGFSLAAETCGLAFSGLSSDCEAEFIKISHDGFFGIMAKKDYGGNPPMPVPVFSNLCIHDCFVENVTEGMYLGETKSPGMEFRHVRIYNNIVRNTGRESIQIANMVEDVEVFNNTLLNAGLDGVNYHGNILQIGDNTVVKAYNNILCGAPAYGIINMGSGNNYFINNFVSDCKGVFIDDRDFTLNDSLITFSDNYFSNIINPEHEIIRNLNGENYLIIENNKYDDSEALFYRNYFKSNNNYALKDNRVTVIAPILFTNEAENDYSLSEENPEEYRNMGAPGGIEYFANNEKPAEDEIKPYQIILTPEMVTDEVAGGSYYSPNYLVDEQSFTPGKGLHPVSQNWKPYWNMDNGPYHIYIDLQEEYHLTNISLHDMHSVKNLDVSVGEPGNWTPLFTENCNRYKTWKEHNIDVTTRYIRLSMNESVYAGVNEIVVFGYSVLDGDTNLEKSASNHFKEGSSANTNIINAENNVDDRGKDLFLCQNPVADNIWLNIPQELYDEFTIEIFSLTGMKMLTKKYISNYSSKLMINISEQRMKNGMYILRYSNSNGFSKSIRFLKQTV